MARSLSEAVGERIGLRARMVSKSGPRTRIEFVTEGVFTRMILDDPELSGIGAVLFDEFHERSLDADLGLALALDCQRGLRDDLRIMAMSATLDGARLAISPEWKASAYLQYTWPAPVAGGRPPSMVAT